MPYALDPIAKTRTSSKRQKQASSDRHGGKDDVHILGIVSYSKERVAEISWDFGSEFEIRSIAPAHVANAPEVTICSAFIVDGALEELVFVTGRLARTVSPCVPIITLCDPCHPEGIAALMTGADFVLRSPIRAVTIQAHIAAFQRRVAPLSDDVSQNVTVTPTQSSDPATEQIRELSPDPEDQSTGVHLQSVGPVAIDTMSNTLWIEGTAYPLSVRPADLFCYLMEHQGTVCTRDEILREVWELDFDPSTNLVDVQVYTIRRMLEKHDLQAMIHTVRGRGYRFQWPLT